MVLEIAFDANDGRVFFSADEKVLVDERRLPLLGAATQTATFEVEAGVNGSAEVPVELRIDNVKVY